MMENIKAAIFDLDGTLIDSMYVWEKVDHDFLTERGIPVTQDYTDKMRTMFFHTAAEYTKKEYALSESVEEIMNIWLSMARHEYEFHVKAKPFVKEYLKELKDQGMKIGIATSSDPYLSEPVLKNNDLKEYFDCVCFTSEVGKNKNYPDIYLYTAEKLGTKPEECIVFEDIPEGINGASTAGMKTVAVYDESSTELEELLRKSADQYIYSFSEMFGGKFYGKK